MTLFDGPYPYDHLYLKLAGCKGIHSAPLCELFTPSQVANAVFDPKQSNAEFIVLIEQRPGGNQYRASRADFIKRVQQDTFKDTMKIVDIYIQPEGEMQTPELTQFIEKYNN